MVLLIKILKKRYILTLAAIFSSGLASIITLLWNWQLSDIINIVSSGKHLPIHIIISALITMFFMSITAYIKGYMSGLTCESLTHDLRMGYARYFTSLPISEIEQLNAGEQLSKLQNEIADVSRYLNSNLFQILDDFIRFITTFIWLLILNAKLTLSVNLPVFAILIYVFYSSKAISNAYEKSQQANGIMNKYADTLLTLFPIIQLYNAAHMILSDYKREVEKWEHQTSRAERIKARLMSLSGMLSNIPLMLLFLIGGRMVINGSLTIGTLYIFLNLSGNISGVMMNMPNYIAAFRQFSINMKRLSFKISL